MDRLRLDHLPPALGSRRALLRNTLALTLLAIATRVAAEFRPNLLRIGYQKSAVMLSLLRSRAAFERGSVDAWAIWEPFESAAEKQVDGRVLADGQGVVSNHTFWLAERRSSLETRTIDEPVLREQQKIADAFLALKLIPKPIQVRDAVLATRR